MRTPAVSAPEPFRQQLLEALPRVRRYARSLTFDDSATDDLVQSTVERALTHWHQFDQRRDIRVWLLSIAHNAHLDRLRRERRLVILEPEQLANNRSMIDHNPGTGGIVGLGGGFISHT